MAYQRYTTTFELTYRNRMVSITEKYTGTPAIILSSVNGGILSAQGISQLSDTAVLDVVIDTAKQWDFNVDDGQTISYNVVNPKQVVSRGQLLRLDPQRGVTYVVDEPPYPEYRWDGNNLVSDLDSDDVNVVKGLSDSTISNITMNQDGKIAEYTSQGIVHTISYPTANTVVFSNETGVIKTVTLDSNGVVLSIT